MPFQCPPLDETDSKKNKFEPKCGIEVFKTFHTSLDNINDEYLKHLNKINDPILKYISVYFVQHYMYGYKYYGNSEDVHRTAACRYLNQWLMKQRDLFTYGNKCPTKLSLWNYNIETLWNMLIKDSKYFYNKNKPWCSDYHMSEFTNFPSGWSFPNCDEIISEKSSRDVILTSPTENDCNCPQNVVPENMPQLNESQDIHPTRKIAFTSGLTTAGTVGTLLLLYKYTPVSSWFRRRGMNNVGRDLYMNPGAAESFLSMQQDNGSNNLFYHP